MKAIYEQFEDADHAALKAAKGKKSWKAFIIERCIPKPNNDNIDTPE